MTISLYIHIFSIMTNIIDKRLDILLAEAVVERQKRLRRSLAESILGKRDAAKSSARSTTPQQLEIIDVLEALGRAAAVKEIAAYLQAPYANVTRTLDRLERKGWIRRSSGKPDRRQVLIRLTLEGKKAAARLEASYQRFLADFWGKIQGPEKTLLFDLLTKLTSHARTGDF